MEGDRSRKYGSAMKFNLISNSNYGIGNWKIEINNQGIKKKGNFEEGWDWEFFTNFWGGKLVVIIVFGVRIKNLIIKTWGRPKRGKTPES